jgi:hypothetical protein
MRILLTILLVNLPLGFAFSQTHKNIAIPVLEENKDIDSLMGGILRSCETISTYGNQLQKNNCFIIAIDSGPDFIIEFKSKKIVNFFFNYRTDVKPTVGVFKYQGYVVFVFATTNTSDFFKKTRHRLSFSYIFKTKDQTSAPTNPWPDSVWLYDYDNVIHKFNAVPLIEAPSVNR